MVGTLDGDAVLVAVAASWLAMSWKHATSEMPAIVKSSSIERVKPLFAFCDAISSLEIGDKGLRGMWVPRAAVRSGDGFVIGRRRGNRGLGLPDTVRSPGAGADSRTERQE